MRYFLGNLPAETVKEYGQQKDEFFQENFKDVQLIPGIQPFLETLEAAGMQASIATSASSSRTWGTLQRLKLDNKFVTVVTGDDVTAGKPDPAVYRLAAQRMNLSPDELLVLEDAPCGVQGAKSAGMRCFGVTSNGRMEALRRAGADHIISNFLDLSIEKLLQLWIAIPGNNDSPSRSPG